MTIVSENTAIQRKRTPPRRALQTQPVLSAIALAAFALATLAAITAQAAAQTPTSNSGHVELAVTYAANRANSNSATGFWMQGGSIEVGAYTRYHFGLVASISGYHAGATPSRTPVSLVIPVFGPRFLWTFHARAKQPLTVFGQGLVGEAEGLRGSYPAPGGAITSASSLAIQTGGGIDLVVSRHLAWRVVEADWLRTSLPNASSQVQNSLRLTTGIVLRPRPRS